MTRVLSFFRQSDKADPPPFSPVHVCRVYRHKTPQVHFEIHLLIYMRSDMYLKLLHRSGFPLRQGDLKLNVYLLSLLLKSSNLNIPPKKLHINFGYFEGITIIAEIFLHNPPSYR